MVEPDFEEWADKLIEAGTVYDTYTGIIMLNSFPDILKEALKQAYDQGASLGNCEISAVKQVIENLKREFPNGFYEE